MLRNADNVSMSFAPSFWSTITGGDRGTVTVAIGRTVYTYAYTKGQYQRDAQLQHTQPVHILSPKGTHRQYWLYQGRFYWEDEGLDAQSVHALLTVRQQRNQTRAQRAIQTIAAGSMPRNGSRERIPDDLKHLVWTRDAGRCVRCGANSELQYDHIIPVVKGGATSADNLQLLCGPCNRRKGANITFR